MDLKIANFAPLIQLWAGVCLLCFYEAFVKKSPFSENAEKIIDRFNRFFYSFGLSGKIADLETYNNAIKKLDKWYNIKCAIKNMAAVSIAMAILLLIYGACESDLNPISYYNIFQWISIAVLIFMIVSVLFYKRRMISSAWFPAIYIILLAGFFFAALSFHSICEADCYLPKNALWICTLVVMMIGCVFIWLRIRYNGYLVYEASIRLKKLSRNYNLLSGLIVRGEKLSVLENKDKKLYAKIRGNMLNEVRDSSAQLEVLERKWIEFELEEKLEKFRVGLTSGKWNDDWCEALKFVIKALWYGNSKLKDDTGIWIEEKGANVDFDLCMKAISTEKSDENSDIDGEVIDRLRNKWIKKGKKSLTPEEVEVLVNHGVVTVGKKSDIKTYRLVNKL